QLPLHCIKYIPVFFCFKKEKKEILVVFLVFPLFERNGHGFALCFIFFFSQTWRFVSSLPEVLLTKLHMNSECGLRRLRQIHSLEQRQLFLHAKAAQQILLKIIPYV